MTVDSCREAATAAPASGSTPAVRRSRKSSAELRTLLIDTARTMFANRGFSGTTTREIARLAGTSEAVLFRHFGSKAGLFGASLIAPFSSFILRFSEKWTTAEQPHPAETPAREFFGELYAMLRDQRDVVLTLMAAHHHHEPDVEVDTNIAILLERLEAVASRELKARGWRHVDMPVAVRISFGMALGNALFKEWLYTDPEVIPDDRIIDEMVGILLGGASGGRADITSEACTVIEQPDRRRIEFSGAEPAVLMREASNWLARYGHAVDDVSWQDGRLRLYY
ncbi:TetR/AcrR family transcriptional regulator [Mycobacterium avium]